MTLTVYTTAPDFPFVHVSRVVESNDPGALNMVIVEEAAKPNYFSHRINSQATAPLHSSYLDATGRDRTPLHTIDS